MLADQVCICANSEVSYLGDVPHRPPFYAKPAGEEMENKNKGGGGGALLMINSFTINLVPQVLSE